MAFSAWTGETLEAAIKRWLEEEDSDGGADELDESMAEIFGFAELQLQTTLGLETFAEEDTSLTMTSGSNKITKPSDHINTRSMWYEPVGAGARTYLEPKTVEYLNVYWPNDATTGSPLFYAEFSTTEWMVAPTPDANYPLAVRHEVRLDGLTPGTAATTTYLSRVYPDALFYACMAHAEAMLMADDRVALWDNRWVQAMPMHLRQQLMKQRRSYGRPKAQPQATEPEG